MAPLSAPRRWLSYTLSGLLILMLVFLVFGEWGLIHYWRLYGERVRLEERTRALQAENEILREKVFRLGHDDRYLEKVVREELGLAREGEIVYRFPNLPSHAEASSSESHPSSERNERR